MNIDFHYGVVYLIARQGGLDKDSAQIVAHACQYIDDATTPGLLKFVGGETFERFASAHKMFDYRNADNDENRIVWAPFHFLPGAQGVTLEQKALCRPNSVVAKDMVRRAIEHKGAENSLHRLGVTLHVYVDTWAHQGFSGTESKYNKLTSLVGDQHDHQTWFQKLKSELDVIEENLEAVTLDIVSGLGHGAALHFPDMPWAKWKYTNAHGDKIERDNLPDFMEAADMACKVVQAFNAGDQDFERQLGLSSQVKKDLEKLLQENQDHDELKRFAVLCDKVGAGQISGIKESIPPYIAKGIGSWKEMATGITVDGDGSQKPTWSAIFEASHYRRFHDAVKEHRFIVTQEILPAHGVRLA